MFLQIEREEFLRRLGERMIAQLLRELGAWSLELGAKSWDWERRAWSWELGVFSWLRARRSMRAAVAGQLASGEQNERIPRGDAFPAGNLFDARPGFGHAFIGPGRTAGERKLEKRGLQLLR